GLARLAGARGLPLPASADSWLAHAPQDGRHLVVLDALRAAHALRDAETYLAGVQALEVRWLAPLLEALRTQRIGMLSLHAPDATEALSIETVRADLRRFWRRPRALAPWKD
ncbi:MAG: regulator, partial [Burkholderiales bacterium]|nr:regulator [Burkholderiales bacterium]